MRSPWQFAQSFIIPEKVTPKTITEQNFRGMTLDPKSIDLLISLYATADKELYFGVGRNLLFHVYQ